MARDYKTKRSKPGAFSGWIGLACGLGLGLAVAGIVYLKDHRLDAPNALTEKVVKKRTRGGEPPEQPVGNTLRHQVEIFQRVGCPRPPWRRQVHVVLIGLIHHRHHPDSPHAALLLCNIEASRESISPAN